MDACFFGILFKGVLKTGDKYSKKTCSSGKKAIVFGKKAIYKF